MAKAPKSVSRETSTVSQETLQTTLEKIEAAKPGEGIEIPAEQFAAFNTYLAERAAIASSIEAKCSNCLSWRAEVGIPFGGCAKSGLTTTHYGETRYVHYTPDGASCSAFEAKE